MAAPNTLDGAATPPPPGRSSTARVPALRRLAVVFQGAETAIAVGVLGIAVGIAILLVLQSVPAFRAFGFSFLWGEVWDFDNQVYGALPAIVGTAITSSLALLLALPVALGVAVFSSELAPRWARGPLTFVVDLAATIPSIVYGFWALAVLVPLMRDQIEPALSRLFGGGFLFSGEPTGYDLLTASVILAIMIIPTIAALSREAMRAVPRIHRETALSLGATRLEASRLAVFGPARWGILAAIIIGLGRAIGETIAVTLVIGGEYQMPTSLFSPGQSIPSWLVTLINDSYGLQYSALLALGLILFVISVGINFVARSWVARAESGKHILPRRWFHRHHRVGPGLVAASGAPSAAVDWRERARRRFPAVLLRRRIVFVIVAALLVGAVILALLPFASILYTAVREGGPAIVHPGFFTEEFPVACINPNPAECPLGGIGPAIQGTLILLALAAPIGLPIGIMTGIYLSHYGSRRLGRTIGLFVDGLVALPTILLGIFVFALFFQLDQVNDRSALAGGVALGLLMIPIVARATEEALRTVPTGVRESALALGFPRYRVTTRIELGSSRSAIITGNLLAIGRAGGETAAVFVTAGVSQYFFTDIHSPISTLATTIYAALTLADASNWTTDAWGAALVLLLIMVGISLAARLSLRGGGVAESV